MVMTDDINNNEESNELNDAVENSDAGELSSEEQHQLDQQNQANTNTVTSTVASGAASEAAQTSSGQSDDGGAVSSADDEEEDSNGGSGSDSSTFASSDTSSQSSAVTSSSEEEQAASDAESFSSAGDSVVGSQAVGGEESSSDSTPSSSVNNPTAPPSSSTAASSTSANTQSSSSAEDESELDTQTHSETFNVDVLDTDDDAANSEDDFDQETTSQVFDVQVDATNDAPVVGAGVDLAASEDIDKVLTYEELIGNAYDVDGDELTIQNIALSNDAHGSIVDNGDGTVTYTPSADFNGAVEFTYDLYDGEFSTPVTSNIEVAAINDAPRSSGPIVLTDSEDSDVTFTAASLLDSMEDIDSSVLQLEAISYSGSDGSLADNGDGTYTFSPNENFSGNIEIDFSLHDGEYVVSESLHVNFISVNDLPEIGASPSFSMYEDGSLQISPLELLNGVTDVEGDVLSIVDLELADPSQGSLVTDQEGNFSFIPNEDFNGDIQLNYQVFDGTGSVPHTAEVNVAAVNDSAVVQDQSFAMDEDGVITITDADLLSGASDIDGDTLTISDVTYTGSDGVLTDNGDGTHSFSPNENFNGDVNLGFSVSDGTATTDANMNVSVVDVNDAPVAGSTSYQVNEDGVINISPEQLLANSSDVDGTVSVDSVSYSGTDGVLTQNDDGSVSFAPNENFNGDISLDVVVVDDDGATASTTAGIETIAVNDTPVVSGNVAYSVDEDGTITLSQEQLLVNASDVDGDDLTASNLSVGDNATVTINDDGTFTVTPDADFNGDLDLSFDVSDTSGATVATGVNLTVNPVNDATVVQDQSFDMDEDGVITITDADLLSGASDIDGDDLSISEVTYTGTDGVLTDNGDGTHSFAPNENFNGDVDLGFSVSDGTTTTDANINVTVADVNDAPVAGSTSYQVNEDGQVTISPEQLLANSSDVDGTFSLDSVSYSGTDGILVQNENGSVTFSPNENFNGDISLDVVVIDDDGATSSTVSGINVIAVNDTSVVEGSLSYSMAEDGTITLSQAQLLSNVTDVDGDTLTATNLSVGDNATVTANDDGSFTITPDEHSNETLNISFDVNDGTDSVVSSGSISVSGVADAAQSSLLEETVNDGSINAVDESYENFEGGSEQTEAFLTGTLGTAGGQDVYTFTHEGGPLTLNALTEHSTGSDYNDLDGSGSQERLDIMLELTTASGTRVAFNDDGGARAGSDAVSDGSLHGYDSYIHQENLPAGDYIVNVTSYGAASTGPYSITMTGSFELEENPYETDQGDTLIIDNTMLLSNDDVDASFSMTSVQEAQHGTVSINAEGDIEFIPNDDYAGIASFTYTITDANGNEDTARVTLNVTGENTSGEEAVLQADILRGVSALNMTEDEVSSFTELLGPVTFPDGDGSEEHTVRVEFDATAMVEAPTYIENGEVHNFTLADGVYFAEVDGDNLDDIQISMPENFSGNVTGEVTLISVENDVARLENGDIDTSSDGYYEHSHVVNLNVSDVDDELVLNVESTKTVDEDGQTTISFTATDSDNEVVSTVASAVHGEVIVNDDGTISYSPDANYNGADTVTVTTTNDAGIAVTETSAITVNDINDAPTISSTNYVMDEDGQISISSEQLLANAADIDGTVTLDSVSYSGTDGILTQNEDGSITFSPNENFNGDIPLDVTVVDDDGAIASTTSNLEVVAVNDMPVVDGNIAYTIDEDGTVTLSQAQLLANASDVEGDDLTASNLSVGDNATVTANDDGSFTVTPNADFNGDLDLRFDVSDSAGATVASNVDLTVNPVNDAAVVQDQSFNMDEDGVITITDDQLLSGASDVDGDNLSITDVTYTGSDGVLTDNGDGTHSFAPNENFNGDVNLGFSVSDGTATTDANMNVSVSDVNDAPVVGSTSYQVNEDGVINISPEQLLANSSDVDGTVSVDSVNYSGADGILTQNNDGSVSFAPNENFNGDISLELVVIDDDGATGSTTAGIEVIAVNDTPVAGSTSYQVAEDGTLTISPEQLLANSSDVEGEVSVDSVSYSGTDGVLTQNDDGSVSFAPNENFNGNVSLDVVVIDEEGATDTTTAGIETIAVNDVPVVSGNVAYSVDEDGTITLSQDQLLANASDVDGDDLAASNLSVGDNASVTANVNGSFTVTPDANFNGELDLSFDVSDTSGATVASGVNLMVNSINDGPVASDDGAHNGTLVLGDDDYLRLDTGLANSGGQSTVSIWFKTEDESGELFSVNNGDGSWDRAIQIEDDGEMSMYTWARTEYGTETTNDQNVADNEWHHVVYSLDGDNGEMYIDGELVATSDIGASGFDWSAGMNIGAGFNGEIRDVNIFEGTGATSDEVDQLFAGDIPETLADDLFISMDFEGDNPFEVEGHNVTVHGNPQVEDQLTGDLTAADDVVTNFDVLANDSDVEGDISITGLSDAVDASGTVLGSLSIVNVDGTEQVQFMPNADALAMDSGEAVTATFTYEITDTDGATDTATVAFNFEGTNDTPVISENVAANVAEDGSITLTQADLLDNASDADGEALTASNITVSGDATVSDNGDGSFTVTPSADFNGNLDISYDVSDGTETVSAGVDLTVTPVNDAPIVEHVSYTAEEDGSLTFTNAQLLGAASDIDSGDMLSVDSVSYSGTDGVFTDNGDGSYSFSPNEHFNGDVALDFSVSDGTTSTASNVDMTFTPVNDAPVAGSTSYSVQEDGLLTFSDAQLLAESSDVDSQHSVEGVSYSGSDGILTDNGDGTYDFAPNEHFNGDVSFDVVVTDGELSDTTTADVSVISVNDTPIVDGNLAYSVDEDGSITLSQEQLLSNASDADGDDLSASNLSAGGNATVTANDDGSFTVTPDADFNGDLDLSFDVSDTSGATVASNVDLTVNPVNDVAVVQDLDLSGTEDNTITITQADLLASSTDVDGDSLTASNLSIDDSFGTVTDNGDGSFSFEPAADFNGDVPFSFTVSDGTADTSAHGNLNLAAVNDAPVLAETSFEMNEDNSIVITEAQLLENATDIDADSLSITDISAADGNGTVEQNADGDWVYTPTDNYSGDANLTISVNDGTTTVDFNSPVTITPDADAPSLTVSLATTDVAEFGDSSTAGGVLSGWQTDNGGGHIEVNPDYIYGVGENRGSVMELERNAGDESNVYQNLDIEAGDTIELSFDISARAGMAGADSQVDIYFEGVLIDSIQPDVGWETHTYSLTATSDNPRLELDSPSHNGVGAVLDVITVTGVSGTDEETAIGIDIDAALVDGDGSESMQSIEVENIPEGATLTDGTNTFVATADNNSFDVKDWDLDSLTITTGDNFSGDVALDIVATSVENANGDTSSTTQTLNFTVEDVNDAVVIDAGSTPEFNAAEDTSFTITEVALLSNASDVDSEDLIVTNLSIPNATFVTSIDAETGEKSFIVTPDENFNGDVDIAFSVSDQEGSEVQSGASLTVAAVNDEAVVQDQAFSMDEDGIITITDDQLLSGASDVDGDDLSITDVTYSGTDGILTDNGDGTHSFAPNENFNGDVDLGFSVSDGTAITDANINVSVADVNDAPVAGSTSYQVNEDGVINISSDQLLANSSDIDGTVSVDSVSYAGTDGILTSNDDGSVSFAPNENFNGDISLDVTIIDDDGATATTTAGIETIAVNDTPVVSGNVAYSVDEDGTITLSQEQLLVNASDVDGDDLTASNLNVGGNATVTTNDDGTFTVTPDANFNGELDLSFDVSDTSGATVATGVDLTVTSVNDGPVVSSVVAISQDEDASVIIDPAQLVSTLPVSDIDGDTLTITNMSYDGSDGTFVANDDGTYTITGGNDFVGTMPISYTVEDGQGGSATGLINVDIVNVNDLPEPGAAINTSMQEDGSYTFSNADLLSNASDVDGDIISVTGVSLSDVSQGVVVTNDDGTYTFTPHENFNGEVSLDYTISDGQSEVSNHLTVDVEAVNDMPDAPTLVMNGAEDRVLTIDPEFILSQASDLDGDTLSLESLTVKQPEGAQLNPQVDGTYQLVAAADFNGLIELAYQISDGIEVVEGSLNVDVEPVNDAAFNTGNAQLAVVEDGAVTFNANDMLDLFHDVDGDSLVVSRVVVADGSDAEGELNDNGDGTWTFTPTGNFSGTSELEVVVSDGTVETTMSVPVYIRPEADGVVITSSHDGPLVFNEDSSGLLNLSVNLLDDSETLSNLVMTGYPVGFTVTDGNFTFTVTEPGQLINVTDWDMSQVIMTPPQDWNGSFQVTVTATTVDYGDAGSSVANESSVPVDDFDVAEGGSIILTRDDLLGMAENSETQEDDDITLVHLIDGSQGSMVDNGDDTWSFTPSSDFSGNVEFAYVIERDGEFIDEQSSIMVNPTVSETAAGESPKVDGIATTNVSEGSTLEFTDANMLAQLSDADGDVLSIESVQLLSGEGVLEAHGDGNYSFSPDEGFTGEAQVGFIASDGENTISSHFNIDTNAAPDVAVTNASQFALTEDGSIELTTEDLLGAVSAQDLDGDSLSINTVNLVGEDGTIIDNGDSTWTFWPDPEFNGNVDVNFNVTDGENTTSASVILTVSAENDAPTVGAPLEADIEMNQVMNFTLEDLLSNVSDIEGDNLSVSNFQSEHATVTDNGDGTYAVATAAEYEGEASITYDVSDGSETVSAQLNLAVETPESEVSEIDMTAAPGDVLRISIPEGVSSNEDLDHIIVSNLPEGSSLSSGIDNGDGSYTLSGDLSQPVTVNLDASFEGQASISIHGHDSNDQPIDGAHSDITIDVDGGYALQDNSGNLVSNEVDYSANNDLDDWTNFDGSVDFDPLADTGGLDDQNVGNENQDLGNDVGDNY